MKGKVQRVGKILLIGILLLSMVFVGNEPTVDAAGVKKQINGILMNETVGKGNKQDEPKDYGSVPYVYNKN